MPLSAFMGGMVLGPATAEMPTWHLHALVPSCPPHPCSLANTSGCGADVNPGPFGKVIQGLLNLSTPGARPPPEQTRRQTAEACLKAGVFFHFPCIPDPNLNPRTESCQPGCSRADIAAGIFSAAFPQICLLLGRLKRTPRFLCYWMIHSVPSSKALGLPGGRKQAEGGRGLRC